MQEPQYKVGTLYNPDRTVWEQRADFNYRKVEDGTSGMLELRLFYERLSKDEIQVVSKGECTFGYAYLYSGVIFFLYKFGDSSIFGDCSFSSHLVSEEDRAELPLPGDETFGKLFIILVEATTGIIKALRLIQLSDDFSSYFYDTIGAEREREFSREQYDRDIQKVYSKYPDVYSLFRTVSHVCVVEPKVTLN